MIRLNWTVPPLDALELYLSLKAYAPKGVETDNSSEVRDALMQEFENYNTIRT